MSAPSDDLGLAARHLMRGASSAALSTVAEGGQPFVSLVTPAVAPDGAVLLWLSTLSEHTRHLAAEPRCALLFQGAPEEPNPQTAPRVTVTGLAARVEDPALKARWLARHPYAALYADFADFALWRIAPGGALLVGGFARAHRLRAAALVPDPEAVATLAAAEPGILDHVNADHADALAVIAAMLGGAPGPRRMANLSPDGCDLTGEADTLFLPFPTPAATPGDVRAALVAAARRARAGEGA